MTLPASFPISASQINVELGRSPTAPFDIQGAAERALAEVPSGAISFSDFLGKTAFGAAYLTSSSQAASSSTYTFAGTAFGTAATAREIFVGVSWGGTITARTLTSATIGGVAATIKNQINLSDGSSQSIGVAIIHAAVPSGTSGSVVLNFSGNNSMCAIGVYAVYGRNSFSDDGTDFYSGVNTIHVEKTDNTIGTNGIVIGAVAFSDPNFGISWSGPAEVYDAANGGTRFSGALVTGLSSQINYTIQATQTVASPPSGAVLAEVCIQ